MLAVHHGRHRACRRVPFSPISTASPRSFGMPRFVANRLAVPAGKMASATGAPADRVDDALHRSVAAPHEDEIGAASSTASWLARPRAGSSGTSYHMGSLIPWVESVFLSSARPPPSVFAEWASTPTEVKAAPRRRPAMSRPSSRIVSAPIGDRAGRPGGQQREHQRSGSQHDAPHDVRGVVHTPIEAGDTNEDRDRDRQDPHERLGRWCYERTRRG